MEVEKGPLETYTPRLVPFGTTGETGRNRRLQAADYRLQTTGNRLKQARGLHAVVVCDQNVHMSSFSGDYNAPARI